MAETNLRTYIQEIDNLIEEGQQLEEAIAHCRHILKTYPKHIDTYRLLGKAYLESKRYGDAADIFQRVLSALPDDFVAHIGMAIIREDEGNLDAAIWHMERASEAKPGNPAIEQELKRLIGKRDGVEPQRVRPTRGALARMYYNGELYSYATTELRTALEEDPDRPDLQVLLANTYWRTDNRLDAANLCSQILEKLPFCCDANRITAALLQEEGKAEEAAVNLRRLVALDPYEAFVDNPMDDPLTVESGACRVERLTWIPGQPMPASDLDQPDWATSLGVDLRGEPETPSAKAEVPSWLQKPPEDLEEGEVETAEEPSAPVHPFAGAKPPPGAEIPDWMREAGWVEGTGEATEGPMDLTTLEEDTEVEDQPIERADIPDWLQTIAPEEEAEVQEIPEEEELVLQETEEEAPAPELISDVPEETVEEAPAPAWISGLPKDTLEVTTEPSEQPIEPDFGVVDEAPVTDFPEPEFEDITSFEEEVEPFSEELVDEDISQEIPSWLDSSAPGATDTIVSWLGDKSEEEEPTEDVPAWMRGTGPLSELLQEEPTIGEIEEAPEIPSIEFEELPSDEPLIEPEELVEIDEAPEEVEGPEWLEEISEVIREEPVDAMEVDTGEAPEWLDVVPDVIKEEPAPVLDTEAEDAPEWLEDLEAEVEEVETTEIEAEAPEWLEEITVEGETVEAPEEAAEAPGWLSGLEDEESITMVEPADVVEETPDWLREVIEEPTAEVFEDEQEEPKPEWLEGLAQVEVTEEGVLAEDVTIPDSFFDEGYPVEPEIEIKGEELPDWFEGLEPTDEVAETVGEVESEEEAEAPALIDELGEVDEAIGEIPKEPAMEAPSEVLEEGEVPDWIQDLADVTDLTAESVLDEEEEDFDYYDEPTVEGEPPRWLKDISRIVDEEPIEEVKEAEAPILEEEPEPTVEVEEHEEIAPVETVAEIDEAPTPDWLSEIEASEQVIQAISDDAMPPEEVETFPEPALEDLVEVEEEPAWQPEFEEEVVAEEEIIQPLDEAEVDILEPVVEEPTPLEEALPEAFIEPDLIEETPVEEASFEGIDAIAASVDAPIEEEEVLGFLEDLAALQEEAEAEVTPEVDVVEISPELAPEEPQAILEDQVLPEDLDESLAWLEQLAEEDAVEEELVLEDQEPLPEEISDEVPEWLGEVAESAEEVVEEPSPMEEELSSMDTLITRRPPELTDEVTAEQLMEEVEEEVTPSEFEPIEEVVDVEAEVLPEEPDIIPSEPFAVVQKEPSPIEEPVAEDEWVEGEPIAEEEAPIDLARTALEQGNPDLAIQYMKEMIEEKEDMDEVITVLQRAVEDTSVSPALWQTLGDAYMQNGQVSEAIDAYRKGMEAI
ncbi:MAG: tetratricopeptide repeat protein [Anaerolineales bacterium]|nr:tetratricopeptide repeat protein [Anaerolineales bacterium]